VSRDKIPSVLTADYSVFSIDLIHYVRAFIYFML